MGNISSARDWDGHVEIENRASVDVQCSWMKATWKQGERSLTTHPELQPLTISKKTKTKVLLTKGGVDENLDYPFNDVLNDLILQVKWKNNKTKEFPMTYCNHGRAMSHVIITDDEILESGDDQ